MQWGEWSEESEGEGDGDSVRHSGTYSLTRKELG